MSAPVGKIEEFDPEWPVYVERLEFYLEANSITDESKKRSVLLSVMIGPSAYKLVRSLVAPAKRPCRTSHKMRKNALLYKGSFYAIASN